MSSSYTCRYCGGPIIFRTLRVPVTSEPKPHAIGRIVPIHLNGGCQLRLF